MATKSLSPPDQVRSSPIAGSRSTTFKATSPTVKDIKNKSFLFNAAQNIKNEKDSDYMKNIVGEGSTKPDTLSITKEEIEENVTKNATKLKNPKMLRKERLQRQATIKDDDINADISKPAIRQKNVTKLKIDTSAKEKFTSEIQSPTGFLDKSEESKISRICI